MMSMLEPLSILMDAINGHGEAADDEFVCTRIPDPVCYGFEHVGEVDPFVAVEEVASQYKLQHVVGGCGGAEG
jgi:hypothetical protein